MSPSGSCALLSETPASTIRATQRASGSSAPALAPNSQLPCTKARVSPAAQRPKATRRPRGSAVLLQSDPDDGGASDGTYAMIDSAAAATDGSYAPMDSSYPPTDDGPYVATDSSYSDANAADGQGADAAACPAGISWAGMEPALGQPCPPEGQICEDDSCKDSCLEPCNSLPCFECDALECTGGTWQSTFVQLEACDASTMGK
jgi:hypothetical protein